MDYIVKQGRPADFSERPEKEQKIYEFLDDLGILESMTSITRSTILRFSCMSSRVFFICPGYQFMFLMLSLIVFSAFCYFVTMSFDFQIIILFIAIRRFDDQSGVTGLSEFGVYHICFDAFFIDYLAGPEFFVFKVCRISIVKLSSQFSAI